MGLRELEMKRTVKATAALHKAAPSEMARWIQAKDEHDADPECQQKRAELDEAREAVKKAAPEEHAAYVDALWTDLFRFPHYRYY